MKTTYDVIIVGARIAGSALAYELSQKGFTVLLLERSTFPSDVYSTHNFFNNSVAMLREMGVLDKLLATHTPTYKRCYMKFEDAEIDGDMPEVDGETHCLCIRRPYLDTILYEHATAQPGVTGRQGFRVTEVLRADGAVSGVAGVDQDGVRQEYQAKLVVGADGRRSTVRRLVGAQQKLAVPTDYASYVAYYSGFQSDGETCVEFYKIGENIAIVFPTSDGLAVVGVMYPLDNQKEMERFRHDPERAILDLLRESFSSTTFPERLSQATLVGKVKGLHGYDNDWYQGMGPGWALLGDALSFKDPAVGQGMHDALYGARVLAKHLDWNRSWAELAAAYEGEMEAHMMSRFQLACVFTKNIPFTPEQTAVNKLIGSDEQATRAFLGFYNYHNEMEDVEKEVGRILTTISRSSYN
ncbi:2-polyprenyl-6-methoxyphenol hydroxylase-like FAD-dependent oxidoreductase [Tumebacillus sp. BK434]|uniref:NAD(P)/FAD-dependent oxidoreductase n=1 Tax=Tumebacillus sp. BK434 TaxID=2512169 RepID=UPI001049EADF|nr:NAD(P)/FAD-dependent oxidoreductase [Tumebacillus sp. BK434]TCP52178.1 2-polyprenyl-6-methoxyphenol hydroxylase-like FAD-dependent oxidoreductase [Tumebacillus sp. BK434]